MEVAYTSLCLKASCVNTDRVAAAQQYATFAMQAGYTVCISHSKEGQSHSGLTLMPHAY